MTPLTRIQMVVHLQTVDLFAYCSAEQVVRIAGIARQQRFQSGERVYAANDPAEALYCVVEGEVCLSSQQVKTRLIGTRETFGGEEILSDRLRGEDARAETDALVLAIDADDFFDLLSNNIEIVKALFRQLLRQPRRAVALAVETRQADSREAGSREAEDSSEPEAVREMIAGA